MEEVHALLETSRNLQDALSTTIKINHEQVTEIVVADLLGKYKNRVGSGDDLEFSFKNVILFYLTPEELKQLMDT